MNEADDYEGALQQLDDAIYSQDKSLLSDAMTELTNVMEKMTRYTDDGNDKQWTINRCGPSFQLESTCCFARLKECSTQFFFALGS